MYISLKDIVKKLAQNKKLEWKTYEKSVWYIDNDFNKGRISAENAVKALKGEFRYELSEYDYREIEEQLKKK
jgi:hypothetical protein